MRLNYLDDNHNSFAAGLAAAADLPQSFDFGGWRRRQTML
jgi:hypothetical protein